MILKISNGKGNLDDSGGHCEGAGGGGGLSTIYEVIEKDLPYVRS